MVRPQMSKLIDLPNFVKKVEKVKMVKPKRKAKATTSAPPPAEELEDVPMRTFEKFPSLGLELINPFYLMLRV